MKVMPDAAPDALIIRHLPAIKMLTWRQSCDDPKIFFPDPHLKLEAMCSAEAKIFFKTLL